MLFCLFVDKFWMNVPIFLELDEISPYINIFPAISVRIYVVR